MPYPPARPATPRHADREKAREQGRRHQQQPTLSSTQPVFHGPNANQQSPPIARGVLLLRRRRLLLLLLLLLLQLPPRTPVQIAHTDATGHRHTMRRHRCRRLLLGATPFALWVLLAPALLASAPSPAGSGECVSSSASLVAPTDAVPASEPGGVQGKGQEPESEPEPELESHPEPEHELRARAETYRQQCWLHTGDPTKFRVGPGHYVPDAAHGFVYVEVPKAASTAIAANLRASAPGTTGGLTKGLWRAAPPAFPAADTTVQFSCVRDPVARFVSNVNFLTVMDPSLRYLRLRSASNNSSGNDGSAIAGAVADRLLQEGFFNWHLWPQSVYLSRPDGSPGALDFLCDAGSSESMEGMFNVLSQQLGFPEVRNRRVEPAHGTYTRAPVVLASDLGADTLRALCTAYLPDFCCFGFAVPAACDAAAMQARCAVAATEGATEGAGVAAVASEGGDSGGDVEGAVGGIGGGGGGGGGATPPRLQQPQQRQRSGGHAALIDDALAEGVRAAAAAAATTVDWGRKFSAAGSAAAAATAAAGGSATDLAASPAVAPRRQWRRLWDDSGVGEDGGGGWAAWWKPARQPHLYKQAEAFVERYHVPARNDHPGTPTPGSAG